MEIWKPVVGYEGSYAVSNKGIVKSLDRMVLRSDGILQFKSGKVLNRKLNKDGYYQVKLCCGGKAKTAKVHQIVANAFIPKPVNLTDEKYEVNHKDCDRRNNNAENLEWITHSENVRYSIIAKHHICTRDLYGKNNPNYGNHILSERYRADRQLAAERLGRHGAQNGRAVSIILCDEHKVPQKLFDWIGGCAKYLIDIGATKSTNIHAVRDRILSAIKHDKPYLKYYFEKA